MKNSLFSTLLSSGKRKIGDLTEENILSTVEFQLFCATLKPALSANLKPVLCATPQKWYAKNTSVDARQVDIGGS